MSSSAGAQRRWPHRAVGGGAEVLHGEAPGGQAVEPGAGGVVGMRTL